jgi:hypothetical protein
MVRSVIDLQLFTMISKRVVIQVKQPGGFAFIPMGHLESLLYVMSLHSFLMSGQIDPG